MSAGSRPGRRPGSPDTRAAILAAAARAFSERGYDAATTRAIAADAGVDAAMIAHYFGSKEQLFIECVGAPIDPRTLVDQVLDGPADELASRLLTALLRIWDSPAGRSGVALARSAVQHELSARLLREFLLARALRPIVEALSPEPQENAWRASLAASQIMGLIMTRYIVRFEPLSSACHGDIVAAIAPTVQRYLTGPLPSVGELE